MSLARVALCVGVASMVVPSRAQLTAESAKRARASFGGHVASGEVFKRTFAPGFIFVLDPTYRGEAAVGWTIVILRGPTGHENLAGMTPPWRGPSVLDVVNFFPVTGKHAPLSGNEFWFSPEVGDTITWDMLDQPDDKGHVRTHALLRRIEEFGKGRVTIRKFGLTASDANGHVALAWIDFRAELTWPAAYSPR